MDSPKYLKPKGYQLCTKTIMDTSDPDILFDENGVCNYVHNYNAWVQANNPGSEKSEADLKKLIDSIKEEGKGKEYDCIMGLSGGVDSSYLAYLAVKKWGLRPLIVHVDAGWNSELAVNNIENIVNALNIDLHTLVVDWEVIKNLQRAFFQASVPNCDIPQDHAFVSGMYNEARKYKIRHILNGGNMSTESILPAAWGHSYSDLTHIKDIHKHYGKGNLKKFPKHTFYDKLIVNPHIRKYRVHRPLDFMNYNKQEAKKVLINELNWRDYGGKHYESVFTKFFQAHYLPEKFGFDKRKAHISSLIVSGQMTREEGLKEIAEPLYNADELQKDTRFITKKLGFSTQEWSDIMKSAPLKHSDYKTEQRLENFRKSSIYPLATKFYKLLNK